MSAKKKALGKGLGALLEDSQNFANKEYNLPDADIVKTVTEIALESIEANPFQPRKEFDEELLRELAASIKEQGIIQPVTIRKTGTNSYQIISGERRLRASKLAGLEKIPAYVREASDQEMLEMALVENIQRKDLNAIEIAESYNQLIDECGLTQEALSERVGKNRTTVTNYLRLLKLPKEIQSGLQYGKITMGHARAIINVTDPETQINIYNDAVAESYSVREVEEIVRNLDKLEENEQQEEKVAKEKKIVPEKYIEIQKDLSQYFDSEIKIKSKSKGKGSIEIPFKSEKDLERILQMVKSR